MVVNYDVRFGDLINQERIIEKLTHHQVYDTRYIRVNIAQILWRHLIQIRGPTQSKTATKDYCAKTDHRIIFKYEQTAGQSQRK